MAVIGLSELQAVNRLLRAVNQYPVTALDGAGVLGTSIQARAQEVLEEVLLTKLIAGYEENTMTIVLQTDRAIVAGTLSSISAAAQPVLAAAANHGLTVNDGVLFYSTNSTPPLGGPYAISAQDGAMGFTLAANQITTTRAGTAGTWRSASKITVPANTLRVIGDGNDRFRTLAYDATGNKLIDVDHQATQFFDAPVAVKMVFNPGTFGGAGATGSTAFENLQAATKEAVANEAAVIFQRRRRGSPEQDTSLMEEHARTEAVAARPIGNRDDMPINPVPVSLIPPQGRPQQQG